MSSSSSSSSSKDDSSASGPSRHRVDREDREDRAKEDAWVPGPEGRGPSEERLLLAELAWEAGHRWEEIDRMRDFAACRAIVERGAEVQKAVVLSILERLDEVDADGSSGDPGAGSGSGRGSPRPLNAEARFVLRYILMEALDVLLTPALELSAGEFRRLLEWLAGPRREHVSVYPTDAVLRLAERRKRTDSLDEEHRLCLGKLRERLQAPEATYAERRLASRIHEILSGPRDVPLEPGDAWADRARGDLDALDEGDARLWVDLIRHGATARQARPSKTWLRRAGSLIDAIGAEPFVGRMVRWLSELESGGRVGKKGRGGRLVVSEVNGDCLRGLLWACSLVPDPRVCRSLADVAEVCFRKIPGKGPRSLKVGNACIVALSRATGIGAAAHLFRLRDRIRLPSARRKIEEALERAAEREELEIEDLEELSVPTFEFTDVGELRRHFEYFEAMLDVAADRKIELRWRGRDGKVRKSVPGIVRREFPERLSALQSTVRDVRKTLSAQRERLERLLGTDRSWKLETWRQRYLVHPLVATLARRLIWAFQLPDRIALGIWHRGKIVSVSSEPIYGFTEDSRVRLWHPIGFDRRIVLEWRCWLEDHGVVQPFKQAHREVYVLTEAELRTRHYSNRFAAHILKQHQFAGLARARGWRFDLAGTWTYDRTVAEKELGRWGIRAEFWVDAIGAGDSYAESGAALYLGTDQVRFYEASDCRDASPLALADVPALAFTEVMRDVDLFVGVASIGNDPAWVDGGEEGTYQEYWHDYSFGELGEAAVTRRDVIERLLPRLKIAERCEITDRFLVVRGQLRVYRIHLGSGNILMEPNNQYLCIVQDHESSESGHASSQSAVRLPFEGDTTLSLILSKAFLLAADDRIKDPTILEQIRSG